MKLTLGIVTRNRPEFVARLLYASRVGQAQPPDEVLLYDNSEDDRTSIVAERSTDVVYLRGTKRQAGGQNEILRRATGQILALLDDDTRPCPGYYNYVREDYQLDSKGLVAAVGGPAVTVSASGKPAVRVHGGLDYNRVLDRSQILLNADHSPCWIPPRTCEVDILRGANMTFRISYLREIGGFDETYERGTWGEEADPQLTLRRRGYRILYDPRARVDHFVAPSGGNRSGMDQAGLARVALANGRNQVYLLRRHGLLKPGYFARWVFWSFFDAALALREQHEGNSSDVPSNEGDVSPARQRKSWKSIQLTARYVAMGWTTELISPTSRDISRSTAR
jgi:GT2 family glycosyltransferase